MRNGRTFQGTFSRFTSFPSFRKVFTTGFCMDKEIRDYTSKATLLIRVALKSLPSPGHGFANERRSKYVRPRTDQVHMARLLTAI